MKVMSTTTNLPTSLPRLIIVFSAIFLFSGCSSTYHHQVMTNINPATNIYSNYPDKLPGRHALYVDAENMEGIFKTKGTCSGGAHNYLIDARNAFAVSVERTLENIIEEVKSVPQPLDRSDMQARDFESMIVVDARNLEIDLRAMGSWALSMKADAELAVSIVVDGLEGRLMGTSVEADAHFETGPATWNLCEVGAPAIGKAVEEAMKEALEFVGERLSNSPRLRSPRLR